jgi:hypothetical protein
MIGLEASGQKAQVHTVDVSPRCSDCRITLSPVVRLGQSSDPELLGAFPVLAVDSRHRYYAVGANGDRVVVLDSVGQFVTAFGKLGDGPGEWPGVGWILVGPSDSLFVRGGAKTLAFAPNYQFARERRILPYRGEGLALPRDGYVTAAPIRTPEAAGLPLHRIGRDGQPESSFGVESDVIGPGCTACFDYSFAYADDATSFWTMPPNAYRIERYSMGGDLVERHDVPAPWFIPWVGASAEVATARTVLEDIRVHRDTAWVLAQEPNPEWRAATAGAKARRIWRLEVIDVRADRVIATTTLGAATWLTWLGPGLVGRLIPVDNGTYFQWLVSRVIIER